MKEKPDSHAYTNKDPTRREAVGPNRLIAVRHAERPAFFWSFTYFFALLCSYYIVRPMRDEMGIAGGVEHLQWMFSATFVVMLAAVPVFGWVTRRFAVGQFLPYVYFFFIANLLLFFILFKSDITGTGVARAFFIWASVFNLFIVSVFWSLMADIYNTDQTKRLFGMIAAGGTLGALTGPILTATLVLKIGPTNLLLVSAAFLGWAVLCTHRLIAWRASTSATGVEQQIPKDGRQQMERSMKRMGVAAIDLMQIHNLRDWQTHLPVLREWKQAGKIRYIGITTSHGRSHEALEQIMRDSGHLKIPSHAG